RVNLLTTLDLSGLDRLRSAICDENLLTALDLSGCSGLLSLKCGGNFLSELGLDGCYNLRNLECFDNRLTALNLLSCEELIYLNCSGNLLTALDLSSCVKLSELYCNDNRLAGLNLFGLYHLWSVGCRSEGVSFAFTDGGGNTLLVQAGEGGLVRFSCDYLINTVVLSTISDKGYSFERWEGDIDSDEADFYIGIYMWGAKEVTAVFAPDRAKAISLTPSRAVLTAEGDSADFTLALSPATASRAPIKWEVTANAAVELSGLEGTDVLTITANNLFSSAEPAELLVRAYYGGEDGFVTTAKLQLLPGGIDYAGMRITLLESKATINTAKTMGALIPVLISERSALSTAALDEASAMASAGSEIDADIQLLTKDKAGNLNPAQGFSAEWYGEDARYIEIKAEKGTKSLKNVILRLVPKGGDPGIFIEASDKLNLTVKESYPKITVIASGSLNLFFPGEDITLSASSPEGGCEILWALVAGVSAKDVKNVYYGGASGKVMLTAGAAKGNYKLSVPVKVYGYDVSYAPGKAPTVTVKVVNAAPKLKLSAKSVVMIENGGGSTVIDILSTEKGVSTDDVAKKIAKVHFESANTRDIYLEYNRGYSAFYLWASYGSYGGKGQVVVSFIGGASAVKLPLTVKTLSDAKLTFSSKTKAMLVNADHAANASLDIPVSFNATNGYLCNWEIVFVGSGKSAKPFAEHELFGALGTSDIFDSYGETRGVRLRVDDAALLDAWFKQGNEKLNDKKADLNLGSSDLPGKTIKITLTVTAKKAGASVKVSNSGRLNVADSDACVIVTLAPKNTSARILDIDWPGGNDFYWGSDGGNTFTVYLYSGRDENIK
ncbi:MAG: hypothetical protein FWE66_05625, partial [Oscillospiraceae bacterium]|nr:hypothetical protein [Oscillospiraceae bacterium]